MWEGYPKVQYWFLKKLATLVKIWFDFSVLKCISKIHYTYYQLYTDVFFLIRWVVFQKYRGFTAASARCQQNRFCGCHIICHIFTLSLFSEKVIHVIHLIPLKLKVFSSTCRDKKESWIVWFWQPNPARVILTFCVIRSWSWESHQINIFRERSLTHWKPYHNFFYYCFNSFV